MEDERESRDSPAILPGRGGVFGALSDLFWRQPQLLLLLLLAPPAALARHHLSRLAVRAAGAELLLHRRVFRPRHLRADAEDLWRAAPALQSRHHPAHGRHGRRGHASPPPSSAFPIAYYAARYAQGTWKALFYVGVLLPLWSSYLVKVYAWKLILAKEGILNWMFAGLHLTWLLDAWLAMPVIGGQFALGQLHRHVPGLPLCLAALHDPADQGGSGARAGVACWRPPPISARRPARHSATCCCRWRCRGSSRARSSPSR